MKYVLIILMVIGAFLMLYNQVRTEGVATVARIALPVIILYSAAWLWGAKDIVLFKRSKSRDTKSKL